MFASLVKRFLRNVEGLYLVQAIKSARVKEMISEKLKRDVECVPKEVIGGYIKK